MNTNDSKPSNNSNQSSKDPSEKRSDQPKPPITPPLSSPEESTRAYPSETSSRTYSSDPSHYAYPNKPASEEPSKVYTTEPLDTARITREEKKDENQAQKEQEKFEDQTRQTSRNMGGTNSTGNFYLYAASNKEQIITYIVLILGLLILLFVNNLLGGLMIGMVTGYYFSSEIIYYIRNLSQIAGGQKQLRYVVLTALLLGLFIAAPGIFIGAAIVAAFKQVMAGPGTK